MANDGSVHRADRVHPRLTGRVVVTSVAAFFGLCISIYLTLTHYTNVVGLTCPGGGAGKAINCVKVTTSPQSIVFGIPVAVLGLAFFIPMFVLCLPRSWWSPNRYVAPLRLAMSVVSMGFVSYLLYAELFVIHAICLWCSTVHVLTFIIFVAVVTGWDEAVTPRYDLEQSDDLASVELDDAEV